MMSLLTSTQTFVDFVELLLVIGSQELRDLNVSISRGNFNNRL